MKNKKILLFILLLVTSFLFVGCKKDKVDTMYSIKYFVDEVEVDLEPKTYKEGTEIILPTVELKTGEEFSGWHLNKELTGETILNITKDDKGDKTFFGKIIKEEPKSEIASALNYSKYSYELTTIYNELTTNDIYNFDNGNYYIYNDSYKQYFGLVDGFKTYYVNDGSDNYYYINENDPTFIYYVQSLALLDLRTIDTTKLIKNGDNYTFTEDYLKEGCKLFTGVDDEYDSFKLVLKDSKIDYVEIEASTTNNSYLFEFKDFDNVTVTLPKDAYDMNGGVAPTPIIDIYQKQPGEVVTVEGQVTGVYGNNFYISDGTKGILVYLGKNGSHKDKVYVGNNISVSGVIDVYNQVYQIGDVEKIEKIDKQYEVKPVILNDVNPNTLNSLVNDLVTINNLIVSKLPNETNNSFSDILFECTDGIETVTIFISKHIDQNSKSKLLDIVKTLKLNDCIKIENGNIGFHNGNYQISLTNASTITKTEAEVVLRGIEASPQTITFDETKTLDEILANITVNEVYSNNTKVILTKDKYTVDTDNFQFGKIKNYTFKFTYKTYTATCNVIIRDSSNPGVIKSGVNNNQYLTVKDEMGYDPDTNEYYGFNVGLPSIGKPKTLVIPIEFTDCKAPANMVTDLEKAFFGTSQDTGWESLQSYYQKASYGKLTIEGTVLQPYNTNKSTKYFDQQQKKYLKAVDDYYSGKTNVYPISPEQEMIKGALSQYDATINYDEYDTDSNGYIDSIYIIYANSYNDYDDNSLWWAFTTEYETEDFEYYDNVEADFYVFMSYKFLQDEFHGMNVKYNTETIIHETGHLMGLNDYYDYDETYGPDGGLGGGDMMHNNVGDHNAYSKVMLGWIDPMIVSGVNVTVDLNSFGETGDAIFIFKEWKGTFFDEYYVIDFYTPNGLNAASKGEYGLFSIPGIRVFHVDSRLNRKTECFSVFDVTMFNNSTTDHRQIALVEADGKDDISRNEVSNNDDLFIAGTKLTNTKWYDNSKTGFTLIINSITNTKANVTISY